MPGQVLKGWPRKSNGIWFNSIRHASQNPTRFLFFDKSESKNRKGNKQESPPTRNQIENSPLCKY